MDSAVRGESRASLTLAVIAPLVTLAAAWITWAISDRLVIIGPIDRATFGWLVVFPLFVITPAVAGLASFRLELPWRVAAQAIVGGTIAIVTTTQIASGIYQIGCEVITSRALAIPPSLGVGLAGGGAFAVAGLLSAAVAAADQPRRWRGIAVGVASGITAGFVWLWTFAAIFPGGTCVPPPVQ